jgi:UDP-glucose 4-epimerase
MEDKVRNILVTGSEGFIGSNLCDKLENLGYTAIPMDIKTIGDIRSQEQCNDFVNEIDVIIHLAALVDVQESIRIPKYYHKTNIGGTLNLLYAAEFFKVERFIYISSAAAINPTSPYGIQKLASEMYCNFYYKHYGLPTISLRLFNVYGTGNGKGVIDKWITQIKAGERPLVNGGTQTRDFVYVDDVIENIIEHIDGSDTGVVQVGTGVETTITNLCKTLLSVMGSNLKPIVEKPLSGEIEHSCADYTAATTLLPEGLRKMI